MFYFSKFIFLNFMLKRGLDKPVNATGSVFEYITNDKPLSIIVQSDWTICSTQKWISARNKLRFYVTLKWICGNGCHWVYLIQVIWFILEGPSEKRRKLSILFYGSCYHKLYLSIFTDQFMRFLLIDVESVSLEDLDGPNFPLWIGTPPPTFHICLI